jgi:hypothetical protein
MLCPSALYERLNQKAIELEDVLSPVENMMDSLVKLGPAKYADQLPRASHFENLQTAGEAFLITFREYTKSSNNKDLDKKLDPAIERAAGVMERYQRLISVIHEASHGVIACFLELEIGEIFINAQNYLSASISIFPPPLGEPLPPTWGKRAIVAARAGFCGAHIITDYIHAAYGAQADRKLITTAAERYEIDKESFEDLFFISNVLVFFAFPIIFLIASMLLENHSMQPARLKELYIEAVHTMQDDEIVIINEQIRLLS